MYQCPNCNDHYPVSTSDGCCIGENCFGELLVPVGIVQQETVEGLCILVCDISASMSAPAFKGNPAPKLKLVVGAIQRALAQLENISKPANAFVAIVAFGQKAGLIKDASGKPFFKSISTIVKEYGAGGLAGLPAYLYPYFEQDSGKFGRGGTDITGALDCARDVTDCMLRGDLAPLGVSASPKLIAHNSIIDQHGQPISVPNIRVLIYSDGEDTSRGSPKNAFSDMAPTSPLMTAFIGDAGGKGIQQMRDLATLCPSHGQQGFFLIDTPEKQADLRNLFRMASGASGFCPECLRQEVEAFEEALEG